MTQTALPRDLTPLMRTVNTMIQASRRQPASSQRTPPIYQLIEYEDEKKASQLLTSSIPVEILSMFLLKYSSVGVVELELLSRFFTKLELAELTSTQLSVFQLDREYFYISY